MGDLFYLAGFSLFSVGCLVFGKELKRTGRIGLATLFAFVGLLSACLAAMLAIQMPAVHPSSPG